MQAELVEAVKQPVELGLVAYGCDNRRPVSARLDGEPFDQARQQVPAVIPDDDPVAVGGAGRDHRAASGYVLGHVRPPAPLTGVWLSIHARQWGEASSPATGST